MGLCSRLVSKRGMPAEMWILSLLLGMHMLDLSMDMSILGEHTRIDLENWASYYHATVPRHPTASALLLILCLLVVAARLLHGGGSKFFDPIAIAILGLMLHIKCVVEWPALVHTLAHPNPAEGAAVAMASHLDSRLMLTNLFVYATVALVLGGGRIPRRPEYPLLLVALALNSCDSLFDAPAVLHGAANQAYTTACVVNNTVHNPGFIHLFVVPIIIGAVALLGLVRTFKAPSALHRRYEGAALLLVAVCAPVYLIFVEPAELDLLDMTRKQGTASLAFATIESHLRVICTGHLMIVVGSIAALFLHHVVEDMPNPTTESDK